MSLLSIFAQTSDFEFDSRPLVETNLEQSTDSSGFFAALGIFLFVYIAIIIFLLICLVKIYVKANRRWWEAIVPIYSTYVLQKIVGRPGWWTLLYFIPLVNIVVAIINSIDLAKSFGKDTVVGILLFFFSIIMYPVMAFSKSFQYAGPAASPDFKSDKPSSPPSSSVINESTGQPSQTSDTATESGSGSIQQASPDTTSTSQTVTPQNNETVSATEQIPVATSIETPPPVVVSAPETPANSPNSEVVSPTPLDPISEPPTVETPVVEEPVEDTDRPTPPPVNPIA